MSRKNADLADVIARFTDHDLDPHYLGYFHLFNCQRFFEAHEALEQLWLPERGRPKADFYKGLIQLAGAFVHVQHCRFRPAAALFRLAQQNLSRYAPACDQLDLQAVQQIVAQWIACLSSRGVLPAFPQLHLENAPA